MQVIIFRGVPGSGKSTLAAQYRGAAIVSADHYFMHGGEYRFDPAQLPQAHARCLRTFVSLITGYPEDAAIIVDNTNVTVAEVAPYAALALAYGHDLKIITVECHPGTAYARNVHGVPLDRVSTMALLLEDNTSRFPPWWPHEVVRS